MEDTYTHGHHASVLRSHTWRTAKNSAAYLLPHLEPGQHVLDVGCGPGTITLDLAALVTPGTVTGIDRAAEVVAQAAQAAAAAHTDNVAFAVGDVYALDFDDDRFDVVHAHQVLQHLTDPVAALGETRRVLRDGGLLAVRDSDYAAFAWAPDDPRLDRWNELYHHVTARNGAEADAGRYLLGWVRRAGFSDVAVSSSTWTFAEPESRAWWGELWADRCLHSGLAEQALAYGLSDRAELETLAAAWREWATHPDACIAVLHWEVLARA
ncbi:MAG: methyltransferase domain-containing protein [Actinobacteria bacterium]|nr:methyltransferase domain-containing protein [Actinomycetota bacterium]